MMQSRLQPEIEHNRISRRSDWRFLLANPEPQRSICFAGGLLEQAVREISGAVEDPQKPRKACCDLAVATNPDPITLVQAWAALQAGGILYAEWSRLLPGGFQKIDAALKKHGFTDIRFYWPWPDPSQQPPQVWLPLGSPQAIRYYLNNRPKSKTFTGAFVQAVLQRFWQAARWGGFLAPVATIAIKQNLDAVPRYSTGIDGLIRRHWNTTMEGPIPEKITSLLKTGGGRSISKATSLVFINQEDHPRLVVKHARTKEAKMGLSRESAVLHQLYDRRPSVLTSVPRALFFAEKSQTAGLGETMIAGQPLFSMLTKENYRQLALLAAEWLVCLVNKAQVHPRKEWWPRYGEPIFQQFRQNYRGVISDAELVDLQAMLETLDFLPAVFEQRDFSPWNLFLTPDGGLRVLDWESAEPDGLPGPDLFYFLAYHAFFIEKVMPSGDLVAAYQRTWRPDTLTGAVQKECEELYFTRLGLPSTVAPPLRMLTWMIHTQSEFTRLTEDSASLPNTDRLRQGLFFSLWQTEFRRLKGIL